MAYWYESEGYGIYNGQQIDRYTLIALYKQGVGYIVIYGE